MKSDRKRVGVLKSIVCASACMAAFAPAALAQTTTPPVATAPPAPSRCGEIPTTPPALADGATANNDGMTVANTAFTTWAAQVRAIMECRHVEAEELRILSAARTAEFNAGAAQFNATVAAWQAEVDEFNARPARGRR